MKRARPLLALFTLLLAVATHAQQPRRAAQDYLKRGADRYLRGDLDGALAAYDKALMIEPNAADIYVKRGGVRHAKGDLPGALSDFDQALTLDPQAVHNDRSVAEAYSRRGYTRAHRLEVEAAIEDFNKALACYQGNPDYYFRRGNALLVKGDTADAIMDFSDGLALKPDNSQASFAYASRGYAYLLQGDDRAARQDFAQSLKLNKDGKLILRFHLMFLQEQVEELKQRRQRDQQKLTD
ncbi:MAG TPA: tetratricopeptide repeat protein [Pyrinomonadaceae bacterium]|jgi:tetratricopeptide (TPR) repeat protein